MADAPFIRMVPLNKLAPSKANVRKTAREAEIEELAASIAAHGLLQNLTVAPVLDKDGNETGRFEVVAGGRRLRALRLLAKRKVIAKNQPIPCALIGELSGEEVSLAENIFQCPMHPADQYEAFAKLHSEQGMAIEDVAARFGVTPTVVKQRLKLAAVSPMLMQIYRDGGMSLSQLMAFTLTDDHAVQEKVWMSLSYDNSREMIRRLLTEGQVPAADRRAKFVGIDAYEAAGGLILRDLFDAEDEGYFDDPALLEKLVVEKLEKEAEAVMAEGWSWVTVAPEFDYMLTSSMRRIYPEPAPLSDEQQAELEKLEAKYEALSIQYEDEDEEVSDEIEAEFQRLEIAIEALRQEHFRPEDIAISGVFVSLSFDGTIRIERGFVRPEDEPAAGGASGEVSHAGSGNGSAPDERSSGDDDDETDGASTLSDRLLTELTAQRTAALRDALGDSPSSALLALLHTLTMRAFYRPATHSCLEIELRHTALERHAPGIAESKAERSIAKRHGSWAKLLPKEASELWPYLVQLSEDKRLELLAHVVSLTVNAVSLPWERKQGQIESADRLAETLVLDMTRYWQPTAETYFNRVTKAQMLEAVREAVSEKAATRIAGLKKQPMAKAAEKLVKDTGWLPQCLRTPQSDDAVHNGADGMHDEAACSIAAE